MHATVNRPPMRHTSHKSAPLGTVTQPADFEDLASRALERIRRNRKRTGAGSYVLGSPDGRVMVIAEAGGTSHCMIRTHGAWLVGAYASGECAEYPTANQLRDDLAEHYRAALERRRG